MSQFPLFSLPPKTLYRVFEFFKWSELFELSFCSTRTKRVIKWFQTQTEKDNAVTGLCIFFVQGVYEINVENRNGRFCAWRLICTRFDDSCYTFEKHIGQRRINFGSRILLFDKYIDTNGDAVFTNTEDYREEPFLILVRYLMETLNIGIKTLQIHIEHVDFFEIVVENSKWFMNAHYLLLERGSVTESEMTTILQNFQADFLKIECNPGKFYDYGGLISVREIYYRNARFSRRQLLDLDCEEIVIKNPTNFTNEDYNLFIKKWLESDNQKFIFLLAKFEGHYEVLDDLSQEKILEGIEYFPGCPKRYDPVCPENEVWQGEEFEHGLDFIRPSDGKMATILIDSYADQKWFYLQFVVWHQENPDYEDEYYGFYRLFD